MKFSPATSALQSQDFPHYSSRIYMIWEMEPSCFSFNFDCSCTAHSIPAYWPFHMIGSGPFLWHVCTCDTTSCLLCPAGLSIMIAASIYTAKFHVDDSAGGYGHSYVLSWIAFVFSLLLAITYLVLRKKSEWETTSNGKRVGGKRMGGVKPFLGPGKTGVHSQFGRNKMLARAIVNILNIFNWNLNSVYFLWRAWVNWQDGLPKCW